MMDNYVAEELAGRVGALEDRVSEQERFINEIEAVVRDRLAAKGLTVIPRIPERDLIAAICEVTRGKRSKEDYMRLVYQTIVSHFRDQQHNGRQRP